MIKKIFQNIFLLLVSMVSFMALSEAVIRQYYPIFSFSYPQFYFMHDDELGYDISPNVKIASNNIDWEGLEFDIWSNELGCYDSEYDNKENYILLLGDSFTWGYANFEDKWGHLLEKSLGKRFLKCGVTGTETKGQLIKAKRVISQLNRPPEKFIVGYFVGNDVKDRYLFPYKSVYDGHLIRTKYLVDGDGLIKTKTHEDIAKQYKDYRYIRSKEHLGEIEYWLLKSSSIYGLYYRIKYPTQTKPKLGDTKRVLDLTSKNISPDESLIYRVDMSQWKNKAWEDHIHDIEAMSHYSRSVGSDLVFVLIPAKEQVYDFLQKEGIDYSSPNRFLKKIFKSKGIEYIDLIDEFKKVAKDQDIDDLAASEGLYYLKDAHWNEKGNKLAADIIYRYLKK